MNGTDTTAVATGDESPQRAMLLASADVMLGGLSIALVLVAAWLWVQGNVSGTTVLLLASVPALNLGLSALGRDWSLTMSEGIRTLLNVPLAGYIYVATDGFFEAWWIMSLTMVIGIPLILCASTGRALPGLIVTFAFAVCLPLSAYASLGTEGLPTAFGHAFGVLVTGALMSLVAAQVGKLLDSLHAANTLLHARNNEVAESRNELTQILNKMPIGVCVVDASGTPTFANTTAKALLGEQTVMTSDLLDGMYLRGTNEAYERERFPLARALRGETSNVDDVEVVLHDSRVQLYVKAAPISDGDGQVARALLALEDISDKVRAENDRLQGQKLESVGQLAAGVAHEINTPMQYIGDNAHFLKTALDNVMAMLAFHEGLLDEPQVAAEAARERVAAKSKTLKLDFLKRKIPRATASIIEGVEAVSKIVRAMKDFSHPGGDQKQPTDLNRAIETTVTVSRNEWKYSADLQTELDPELPPVPCLPGELNQVILNLIVNAAHAIADKIKTEPGTKGKIAIATRVVANGAVVTVADNGTGIPESIQKKIFDPFFTTKDVGKGTGQGLAIARSIVVDKHGGKLSVESVVGSGTTFSIWLPFDAEDTLQGAA